MPDESAERKSPCRQQQVLIRTVQEHLIRISQLTRSVTEALASQNENTARELDRQLDVAFGENERALGALDQHRKEHGCGRMPDEEFIPADSAEK